MQTAHFGFMVAGIAFIVVGGFMLFGGIRGLARNRKLKEEAAAADELPEETAEAPGKSKKLLLRICLRKKQNDFGRSEEAGGTGRNLSAEEAEKNKKRACVSDSIRTLVFSGQYQRCFLRLDLLCAGLCMVDQQKACTRRIPTKAPILSMPTSFRGRDRPATKD